ncbi:MAG TPA: hypothetical protein VF302_04480 [Candidatus Limnocylindrales bacterium]
MLDGSCVIDPAERLGGIPPHRIVPVSEGGGQGFDGAGVADPAERLGDAHAHQRVGYKNSIRQPRRSGRWLSIARDDSIAAMLASFLYLVVGVGNPDSITRRRRSTRG